MIGTDIPGYTYGTAAVPRSVVSLDELQLLQATLLLGEDDRAALRRSSDLLAPQVEAILDVWYGFVGANPHLLAAFTGHDGQPDQAYLAAVRRRFGRWILDTARAEFDQAWLDYQQEIGVRHTRRGKNRTDAVQAADHIPLRYVLALLIPALGQAVLGGALTTADALATADHELDRIFAGPAMRAAGSSRR